MSHQTIAPNSAVPRIAGLDVARGLALIAMATYHFCWDLELFGYLAPGTVNGGILKLYARSIATSFLFLVGFSLVLATTNGIRWHAYFRRLAMIVGAAAIISVATWFATPNEWIFFGILHSIALFSIVGLIFVSLPWAIALLLASGALVLPHLGLFAMQSPWLWFLGLYATPPNSSDFVPVFPWFAAGLAGIAAANALHYYGLIEKMAKWRADGPVAAKISFLGRHSLAFYLIHQPVLIGVIWMVTQIIRRV
jgi:uncharacterized membrane protein